jgi:hypothetical protein
MSEAEDCWRLRAFQKLNALKLCIRESERDDEAPDDDSEKPLEREDNERELMGCRDDQTLIWW